MACIPAADLLDQLPEIQRQWADGENLWHGFWAAGMLSATAVATYVLIAILKKQLSLNHSLHTILQILSTSLFEKTPIPLVFQRYDEEMSNSTGRNQLVLFDI